jgi:hypothetical protein
MELATLVIGGIERAIYPSYSAIERVCEIGDSMERDQKGNVKKPFDMICEQINELLVEPIDDLKAVILWHEIPIVSKQIQDYISNPGGTPEAKH